MKIIIFFGLVMIAGKVVSTDEFDLVMQKSKECEEELGGPKDLINKMDKGEDVGDETKAGKMALCINGKLGHMNKKGENIPDKLKNHVNKLTEDKKLRKQVIEECGPKNGKTAPEAALNFVKCMVKNFK
ncbi:unnamed protein product [Psylliodes chrysocephalus]|uniref:Uncharacterized protein n=1 Tax=Psylliodes chrysocephalus TaxID=3402493 RepID=A0A9P0CJN1_9CUCU|nr:unnamed protein product [Psylliodes chrysocephala]